jgi:hypothetical protein
LARLVYLDVTGAPAGSRAMGETTWLGRDPTCEVQVEDVRASRRHARIDRQGGEKFVVRDLGSMNGTFINGARLLGEKPLKDGDVISIGAVRLRFEADKKAVARAEHEPSFPAFESLSDPARARKAYEKLRLFHDIARAVLPERDPEEALEKLVIGVKPWIDADRAVLFLVGDTGKMEPVIKWQRDGAGSAIEPSQQALDHVLAGRCTVALHGVEAKPGETMGANILAGGQRAVYGIPVVRGAQVVGVVWMEAKRIGAGDPSDLELIAVLASSLAASVEASPRKPVLH